MFCVKIKKRMNLALRVELILERITVIKMKEMFDVGSDKVATKDQYSR